MRKIGIAAAILAWSAAGGASVDELRTATDKIDAIKSDQLRPGTRINLTTRELNAWVQTQVPTGVRAAVLTIDSPGVATGTAFVDIAKVSRSQGFEPGWLISKLLEGERPVKVTARIQSSHGNATVTVDRVQIGDLEIDGKTLEMLMQYVLLPVYPNATVGRPFELGHNIDHLDLKPATVGVIIGAPH